MAGAVDQRRLLQLDRQIEEGLPQITTTNGRMKVALTRIRAQMRCRAGRASENTMKNGTTVATGGSTRCERNQTVRSLFGIVKKRNRASA